MEIGCIDWCAITGFSLWLYDAIVANRCRAEKIEAISICDKLRASLNSYMRASALENICATFELWNRIDRISTLIDYISVCVCVCVETHDCVVMWMWSIISLAPPILRRAPNLLCTWFSWVDWKSDGINSAWLKTSNEKNYFFSEENITTTIAVRSSVELLQVLPMNNSIRRHNLGCSAPPDNSPNNLKLQSFFSGLFFGVCSSARIKISPVHVVHWQFSLSRHARRVQIDFTSFSSFSPQLHSDEKNRKKKEFKK